MGSKQAFVETKTGAVGGDEKDGLCVFKGIPYAAPPVGKLRWLPPQPVKPWQGVRYAMAYGSIAPQNPMMGGVLEGFQKEEPEDEDCLFLNIWTPGLDDT